ncbi:hypothetical protein [Acinetobacter sp. MD2]|uniref:hypothetical protein n=1 Tax=Acinetobacter sp. MD2 TaxID=2600066 RepID=UPI002D1EFBF3|nr:hypothetical protein [Acinetobacter sp. MD2]MEB3767013.1 hypothetical protein [Acinetobacter sp. MD2]
MKTKILSIPVHQLHRKVLKTVLIILAILPIAQVYVHLWHISHASSQIVLGFFAVSLLCSSFMVGFICALQVLHLPLLAELTALEQRIVTYYQRVPMLFFVILVAYISSDAAAMIVY